jgi:hypothetical protein
MATNNTTTQELATAQAIAANADVSGADYYNALRANPPSTYIQGQTNNPYWEQVLGNFNESHIAKYGIPMNRGWDSDIYAQNQYQTLLAIYRASIPVIPDVGEAELTLLSAKVQAAVAQVQAANLKLTAAQSEYSALVAKYETTFGSTPAFASGGPFSGGLRLVGEQGPELEFTGPSRIYSNSDSKKLLNIDELVAEVKALRAEVKAGNYQIAKHTQKTAKTLEKFDYDGLPAERAV